MSQESHNNRPQDSGRHKRSRDESESVAIGNPTVVFENHPGETYLDRVCEKVLCEDLPMSYQFMGEKFYVRECYRQYYEYILESLSRKFYQISL
jgi:hypothetical protein